MTRSLVLPSCSKHHAVYVKGVNDALAKHPELKDLDLVTLNKYAGTDKIPSDIATPVRNHGRWKGVSAAWYRI
jgi:superoxide dismutase